MNVIRPLFLSVALCTIAVADPSQDAQDRIVEQWSKVKSMVANTMLDGTIEYPSNTIRNQKTGTYKYLRKDGMDLVRQDSQGTQTLALQAQKEVKTTTSTELLIMVADGKYIYTLAEGEQSRIASKRDQAGAGVVIGGKELVETMRRNATLNLLGEDKVDDQEVYVFESLPTGKNSGKYKTRYYVSKDRGLMIKREAIAINDGEEHITTTYFVRNPKFDVEIDPGLFELTFPEGVEVRDMTEKKQ